MEHEDNYVSFEEIQYNELSNQVAKWSGTSVSDLPSGAIHEWPSIFTDSDRVANTVPEQYRGLVNGERGADIESQIRIYAVDTQGNALVEKRESDKYLDANGSSIHIVTKEQAFAMVEQYRRDAVRSGLDSASDAVMANRQNVREHRALPSAGEADVANQFKGTASAEKLAIRGAEAAVEEKMQAQYVSVADGVRRVEAPDGEGYLKAVETSDSNGLPNGRYDLTKAIEANRQADRTYDGQVLHKDKESVYHLVGEELFKHSMFEIAKHKLPEIGSHLAVTYAAGIPQIPVEATAAYVAPQPPHHTRPVESMEANRARAEVAKDLQVLFAHDPRVVDKLSASSEAGARGAAAGAQIDAIAAKVNVHQEYAGELKRVSPDLFEKTASPAMKERIATMVEVAERADQAKTLTGKTQAESGDKQQHGNGDQKKDVEKERRGFQVPSHIRTSVEARTQQARDLLTKAHTLQPLYAAQPQRDHQRPKPPAATKKRGMSR